MLYQTDFFYYTIFFKILHLFCGGLSLFFKKSFEKALKSRAQGKLKICIFT